MKNSTKQQLQQATEANAAEVLALADARGWTKPSMVKYGSPAVLALLNPEAPVRKAQQLARAAYAPAPRKPKGKAAAKRATRPDLFKVVGRVGLELVRGEERLEGVLVLGAPRPKLVGEGSTTDARIEAAGTSERLTLSDASMQRLMDSGARVWVKGKSYIATVQRRA